MNELRPPMTKAEFLNGYIPLWLDLPHGRTRPYAFIKDRVARWVIGWPEHQLWSKEDVITNNAHAWTYLIYPYIEKIEVMDLWAGTIYHIGARDFHDSKKLMNKGGTRYYVVDRVLWEKELLTMWPTVD